MAKKYDLDDIFGYSTFKIVRVKDRRLGILYRVFQVAIFAYIIYNIIREESYLKKEPPVPGAIRISLEAPPTLTTPSYCTGGALPCVFWGSNDIQYPSDGAGFAFFTTRAAVTRYTPPPGCSFLSASSPQDPCFLNIKTTTTGQVLVPKSFIGGIEDYTVMIEHTVRGHVTTVALRNYALDGELRDTKDKLVKSFTKAIRAQTDSKANGDILTVKEILEAAGANLEAPSLAPGADQGEINRSSGIVIVILIEYKNVKGNEIKYTYRPQVIDGAEYKATENIFNLDGSYTIKDRHGIRLVFQQTGEIGEFSPLSLLVSLVAALALFKVATTLVEILMLYILPEKKVYETFKFEDTHDFGDYRKGILPNTNKGEASDINNQP